MTHDARRPASDPRLERVVGVGGAVLMGLGSILGTGIFVSLGVATDVAGPAVLLAVVLGAMVATFNGLSSAQLAASCPVSGGTYEYGYRYLNPMLGFTAGWMFLAAKSASAATAALGLAGYVLTAFGADSHGARVALGIGFVIALTAIVAGGMSRSSHTNAILVSVTLLGLAAFVAAGAPTALGGASERLSPFFATDERGTLSSLLHATAMVFVAYTGYGRIATLGEEIQEPERNIPRAVIVALAVAMLLYGSVAFVAIGSIGAEGFARATRETAAPLEVVAIEFGIPGLGALVAIAAIAAMLGVLLNLLLGLSRVLLAMARRRDVPGGLAEVSAASGSPVRAVLTTGVLIAGLVLSGDVRTTWSFSAFTILVYYALTNLAALRLPPEHRRFPRVLALLGLVSCASLAFFVEVAVWSIGLALIATGIAWHRVARAVGRRGS